MKLSHLGSVALITLLSAYPVGAADLGGNCCSDLEERVAELEATTARKGNRKQILIVYGQVNKSIIHFKLDDEDDTRVIDNPNSGSRFGFRGEAKVNSKLTVGFKLEIGANENSVEFADDSISIRYSEVYAQGTFGRLSLGQGEFAGDGAAEMNLGSTSASTLLSLGPVDSVYFGGALSPFDSGRGQRVRYDTPTMGGFVLSAAWGASDEIDADDVWDAALRYANEFGNVRLAAAIAYRDEGDNTSLFGSASVMEMKSGLFLSGAYGRYDIAGVSTDLDAWHIQGGMQKKINSLGASTFYLEYAKADEIDLEFFGVGFSQNIDAVASELYVGARFYDVDGEDAMSILGGMKIRF